LHLQAIGRALLAQLDDKQLSQLNGSNIGEIDLCSQVLDTIFDVYGEETRSYDVVFGKLGFLNALNAVLPPFKRLVSYIEQFLTLFTKSKRLKMLISSPLDCAG